MARDTNRSGRSSRSGGRVATTAVNLSQAGGVDLAAVAQHGAVDAMQIQLTDEVARPMSDAQAGEGTPPPVPTPAPLASSAEMNVAAAADDLLAERDRYRGLAEAALATAKKSILDTQRDWLWATEWKILRGNLPRASFVGHAIRWETRSRKARKGYIQIYETINLANDRLLSETLRSAMRIIRDGPTGESPSQRRKQSTFASSCVRKNMNTRLSLLADVLHYVEPEQSGLGEEYRLTPRGRRVFNGWPPWDAPDAIPGGGAGETAAEEADADDAPSGD